MKIKSETELLNFLERNSEINSPIQRIKRAWTVTQTPDLEPSSQNNSLKSDKINSENCLNQILKNFCWKLGDSEILTTPESEKIFQYIHRIQNRILKFKRSKTQAHQKPKELQMVLKGHARINSKLMAPAPLKENFRIPRTTPRDKNLLCKRSKLTRANLNGPNTKTVGVGKHSADSKKQIGEPSLAVIENRHSEESKLGKIPNPIKHEVRHMECQTDDIRQITNTQMQTNTKVLACWNCFKSFEAKKGELFQGKVNI